MSAPQQYDDNDAIGTDEVPFDVIEDLDVGDLTDQEGGTLPAAQRVVGSIRKASITTNLIDNKLPPSENNSWTFKSLHLEISIGSAGIDGEGAYANKVMFCDLIAAYNQEACERKARIAGKKAFNAAWWKTEARYPLKQFVKAIHGDVSAVKINDAFLLALIGQAIMFDIKKVKDSFRGEGEYRNELANWRAVEIEAE